MVAGLAWTGADRIIASHCVESSADRPDHRSACLVVSPTSKRVFFPPTLAAKFTRSTVLNCDNPFSLGSKFATGLFKRYPLRASQICEVIALKSEYISLQQKVKQIFLSIGLTDCWEFCRSTTDHLPYHHIKSTLGQLKLTLFCPFP